MIQQTMEEIIMEPEIHLKSLGLALAGSEREKAKEQLKKLMKEKCDLIESVEPCTDSQCALSMVSKSGAGMLLISGTGSCCQLINPDGVARQCGGWGNILGDEGSAYWISYKAIKIIFDHEDGLVKSSHDIAYIKKAVNVYFEIEDKMSLMDIFYSKFDIRKVAGFCVEVAKGATEVKDGLCLYVFDEAGRYLAKHITAQLPSVSEEMLSASGGLQVVCVGSVFKSWDLLRKGFIDVLQGYSEKGKLKEISLLRLTQSVAIGAAFHGARTVNQILPIEYDKNYSVFLNMKF
ncbi:NAGK [Acanthosepion pharaonis]|uniref:N-acetyl-D-glucosamine kinase n=1 Tax=Acanthosepion pharaonis TaxID=158019 RepID=A0A812CSU8_ACAPH|nr:NAGK [Sepia pharaonis]